MNILSDNVKTLLGIWNAIYITKLACELKKAHNEPKGNIMCFFCGKKIKY